jgi:hypothetical protein
MSAHHHPSGSRRVRPNPRASTPLQRAHGGVLSALDTAHRTLGQREWRVFLDLLTIRVAHEYARILDRETTP